jgi:hypothetical protein
MVSSREDPGFPGLHYISDLLNFWHCATFKHPESSLGTGQGLVNLWSVPARVLPDLTTPVRLPILVIVDDDVTFHVPLHDSNIIGDESTFTVSLIPLFFIELRSSFRLGAERDHLI